MPKGVPTEAKTEAEFRARYLLSGNAAKVARELDIPERTGQALAVRAHDDPEFAAACAKQRARAIDAATLMLLRTMQCATDRVESTYMGPDTSGLPEKGPPVQDVTWQAARHVADGHKSLVTMAKLDAEKAGEVGSGPAVVIIEAGTEEPGDDDGSADPA